MAPLLCDMVAWVWVAAAALVVVALQAFLFHRARRNWGVGGNGSTHDSTPIESLPTADPPGANAVDDALLCPHCGEHNDEDFTFCQRCVQRLQ